MSNLKNFLFTSESVSEGHPDKVSDRISDISFWEHGMYDEVYFSPDEITNEILDEYIRLEMDIKDQLISK